DRPSFDLNSLPSNDVTRQYVKHQSGADRLSDGVLDIGAYERQSSSPQPLVLTTTTLPNGTVNASYSVALAATGGVTPYTWSIIGGSLPAGLVLNSSTGVISGTPTSAGSYTFTGQVADSQSPPDTDAKQLSTAVSPPPTAQPNTQQTS